MRARGSPGAKLGDDEPPSFATLLRRYRAAARLTQEELAERAGLSARAITDLERGVRRSPYPDTVNRLAQALQLGATEREALLRARRPQNELGVGRDAAPNTDVSRARAQHLGHVRSGEERKVVTVVLGELAGPSGISPEIDPEDVRDLILRYQARIRSDLERFGGTVERFVGNQLVAFFGAPTAHEDDPERAVRATLAVRDWLIEQGSGVLAKIGIASGEALVTVDALASPDAPIVIGQVVNTAAHLRAAAPPQSIIVDEATFRRTQHAIGYRGIEHVMSTSQGGPVRVWEALRPMAQPGIDPSRHHAPFVGRERELAVLCEQLSWAASEMSPQLVTLVGVPGIGKTRLVAELRNVTSAFGKPVRWRQGRSVPYGGGLSFWALGEIVKAEASILESDSPEEMERKLARAVERVVDDQAEARRITTSLRALMGVGSGESAPAEPRREAFSSWRLFLEAIAQVRPLVLVFEDLHWAEEGLLDFVDELVDHASGVGLLVVVTTRPELLDRRPNWAGGKENALTLSLAPLTQTDTARLIAALVDWPVPGGDVEKTLLASVGGNPLYAEQFCRILLEHGRLAELPETIHGIIAARLDLLADVEKRLLQDAAVIGKVFWLGALEAVGGVSRERTAELLHGLARRQFIHRSRQTSVAGDIEYAFAHELLQEVAYGQIPRAVRADRHLRTAEWIGALGRSEDHAELLAHHYLATLAHARGQSNDTVAVTRHAIEALRRAGLHAMRLSGNRRAAEHFSRAINLLAQLPGVEERSHREADLQLHLGMALFALQGFSAPEVEQAYGRATELMMASTPTTEQFPLHFGLSLFHGHRGNFDYSMRLVERMTELATSGDDTHKLQGLHARWMNSLFGARIDDAILAANEGRAIYRPEMHHATAFLYGNHDPGVCAMSLQALALAFRGDPRTSVTLLREAVVLAHRLGHGVSLAQPLTQLPWALQINGDAFGALQEAEQALTLEERVAHPQFFAIAHAMRGWALASTGRDAEGVNELERALTDELRASTIWAVMVATMLAEIHLRRGRREAARTLLDQARSLTESMPTYYYEPELLRVESAWLSLAGRRADARQRLVASIGIARQHGSLALAVRSALALVQTDSAQREADLKLLQVLCAQLPRDNDADYARDARARISAECELN
jgi:class 3 adenylate cyclase/tetratricopeptide (TPR) repeat protein